MFFVGFVFRFVGFEIRMATSTMPYMFKRERLLVCNDIMVPILNMLDLIQKHLAKKVLGHATETRKKLLCCGYVVFNFRVLSGYLANCQMGLQMTSACPYITTSGATDQPVAPWYFF